MIGLTRTGAVRQRGTETVLAYIPCRLVSVATTGGIFERAELAATRRLLWGPEYQMPEGAEIEIDEERWVMTRGTVAAFRGPNDEVVYQRCDVVRAEAE